MPKKKIVPIKYTSRDFESIKEDLIDHAKRYYPTKINDFSKASFTSFVIDSVAYAGDILSYYLDYQEKRNAYVAAFFDSLVNWSFVEGNLKSVIGSNGADEL